MASSAPRPPVSKELRQWLDWSEAQIAETRNIGEANQVRVAAAEKQGTAIGNLAGASSNELTQTSERTVSQDSNNRLARPILDEAYWTDVAAGRRFVWEHTSTVVPGATNRSSWRNVTWNASGSFIFQPNGSVEGAEAHITPILPIPTSRKIYVEADYSPGFDPQIFIEWRDANGERFEDSVLPPTLATSRSTVDAYPAISMGALKYSVLLVRPAGAGIGATFEPKVFEVVGTDGLAIGPGGISVEDSGGVKTVEINPSLPILAAPTVPVLTSSAASVSVRWNGFLTSGAAPAHLSYVYVEEATAPGGPWTRVGQTLSRAGDVITRPPVGSTRWYRLRAVDTSNRISNNGLSASVTVAGVSIPDLSGDIGAVIATVDGLNKIFYDVIGNPPVAHANGDLWFIVDPGTSAVTGVRIWNGASWVPYRFVADSVFVPSSIGTVSIADGVVTGPKVATRTLTAENIEVGSLGVDVLTPNIGSSIDIRINPAIADMQSDLEEQQRYYRFDSQGLKIGNPTTNEELRLTPGRIEMVQAGNVPTYWEAQVFYVERMIVQAANIGAHRFEKYAAGRTVIRPL